MFLSKLTLTNNPAARQVHRDLASAYEMHRTVMQAFPDRDVGGPGRVLFRVEPNPRGQPPVVLVQSDKRPDWSVLEQRDDYLAVSPVPCKAFDLELTAGQLLQFRLRANPVVRRDGKRHGLYNEAEQYAWLTRKGEAGGFEPADIHIARSETLETRTPKGLHRHFLVDFEGILRVTDPKALAETVAAGIGPAKGYGFGLLSVAAV